MDKAHLKNILFVKELLDDKPNNKRIEMYRWLANISGDPWVTSQLKALADTVEQGTRLSNQLDLKISSPANEDHGNGEK